MADDLTKAPVPPPPVPKGPVIDPGPKSWHPNYVAHRTFTLPNGDKYKRGDILSGKDALAFEAALVTGETSENFASPPPHDFDPAN